MVEILEAHVARRPDARAFVFLSERGGVEAELTFAVLFARARALAGEMLDRGGRPGDRALMVFPPGLDFIVALFGCFLAGIVAVPILPPRRAAKRDASAEIVADCTPRFALTKQDFATAVRDDIRDRLGDHGLEWLVVAEAAAARPAPTLPRPAREDLALLQYTSGSTALPKGVMVTHANLIDNLEMIRLAFGNTSASTHVSWVPLHHDMGLVLVALQAFYLGATCVLMAPVSFLQRPLSWLRAIHDFRAEVAGAPNFGFDLCVSRFRRESMEGIDLSCWRVAFNAAEPVRADTLASFASTFAPYGFDARALHPCYGMAEATLLISGGRRSEGGVIGKASRAAMQVLRIEAPGDEGDTVSIVGCGRALAGGAIAVVDPETRQRLACGVIGEIWARGPNVTRGYWQNQAASQETFAAEIIGEPAVSWLRTGDLGCLDAQGELFVTGRIKDLIIVRGINHYPQDLEYTVQRVDACLRPGFGAAFAIPDPRGQERIVIVQEVERTHRHRIDLDEIAAAIREAVAEEHELSVHEVVLVMPGTIPKTTSGKIQRRLTRQLWQEGRLEAMPAAARTAQP
jgi:acyl-CoA synthetase (AMP-forming)/AMP-acid ligase II